MVPHRARLLLGALALAGTLLGMATLRRAGGDDPPAPARYQVRLDTSKGAIVFDVHRDWAPRGADRFYALVESGYFDQSRFFRVVRGRWAQFGIAGDPAVANAWRRQTIPDDPPKQSNVRGTAAFAFAVPNGRTTQVYINLGDNAATLDHEGFAPFAQVTQGMDAADALNAQYGDRSGGGIRGGKQDPLFAGGNAYLDKTYPGLDAIQRATVLAPGH